MTDSVKSLARTLTVFPLLLAAGLLAVATAAHAAEAQPGKATVRGILGHAQFSRGSSTFTALGPGMDLRPGDLIQTASKSALELDLGEAVGTIRLTEGSVLLIGKIALADTNAGSIAEVQLDLRSGDLLGNVKRVPAGGRFEVKTPAGLAQVTDGKFRVDSQGHVVVVEGKVLFAYVPAAGEPSANVVSGPPAAYFAPTEGVRPAPKPLVREVTSQLRAKLPRR